MSSFLELIVVGIEAVDGVEPSELASRRVIESGSNYVTKQVNLRPVSNSHVFVL